MKDECLLSFVYVDLSVYFHKFVYTHVVYVYYILDDEAMLSNESNTRNLNDIIISTFT